MSRNPELVRRPIQPYQLLTALALAPLLTSLAVSLQVNFFHLPR
jgi:hypothetical protein